jgi:DNA ligase-1
MIHPTLYSKDTLGNIRIWYVESELNRYRITTGLQDGKHTTSIWTECFPTNAGRSNERNSEEQTLFEVNALYENKIARKYNKSINDVDMPNYFQPMLAQKYENFQAGYVQRKYDGGRCIIDNQGMWSRQGKPILSCPHIYDEVKHLFEDNPELILDGELYNHDYKENFNELLSMIRKIKVTPEILENTKKVKYYLYDLPSSKSFNDRLNDMNKLYNENEILFENIKLVESYKVETEEQYDSLHGLFIEQGYEGSIWRNPSSVYEQKRSKGLLKRKDFDEDEFEVVSIGEGKGNWSGAAKYVQCWLPNVDKSSGPNIGNTFESGIKGTRERGIKLLNEEHKVVSIKYFGYTPSIVPKPRFGVATKFWGKERTL